VDRDVAPADGVLLRIRPEELAFAWPVKATRSRRHAAARTRGNFKGPPIYPVHPGRGGLDPGRRPPGASRSTVRTARVDIQSIDLTAPRKVFPLWPGVSRLDPPAARSIEGAAGLDGVTVFEAGGKAAVVRQRRNRGDIVVCSLPELFQNAHLGRADHLALLDRLAESAVRSSSTSSCTDCKRSWGRWRSCGSWGFGPFLVLLLVAALASFWRRRVRVGTRGGRRPRDPRRGGGLRRFARAALPPHAAARHALQLYAKAFEKAVSVQTGLRDAALEARVRDLLPPRPARPAQGKDLAPTDFARELETINLAFRRLNDAKRPGNRRPHTAGPRPT
jgi:hypothetical protein